MDQNTTTRLYDTINGVRINVIQVNFLSLLSKNRYNTFEATVAPYELLADWDDFGSRCGDDHIAADDGNRAAGRCNIGDSIVFRLNVCSFSSSR